jgi:hypothetical protein
MKKISILLLFAAIIGSNITHAQSSSSNDEMMKKMMDAMTPGDMHKMLATMDGKWQGDVTSWWEGPDKPAQKSKGICENKMIMGGRYQQSTMTSQMGGMPFEGMSILGFDNVKKVFVNTWIDNMGTGIMVMEGPYDPATKTIVLRGKYIDPMQGELNTRQTMKMIDNKNQYMEMYTSRPGGKEIRVMEIRYTKL